MLRICFVDMEFFFLLKRTVCLHQWVGPSMGKFILGLSSSFLLLHLLSSDKAHKFAWLVLIKLVVRLHGFYVNMQTGLWLIMECN